jgi:hypothetical protein
VKSQFLEHEKTFFKNSILFPRYYIQKLAAQFPFEDMDPETLRIEFDLFLTKLKRGDENPPFLAKREWKRLLKTD